MGRYVEREGLTRAETYAVEEKALRERRAALERLKRTPGVDAGTLRAINQNLKRTEEETQQLKKNMRAAADTAQRDVEGMKPLRQKALNNTHQGNLKRLEDAYVKMARQAEREASRGDTRGMERTIAAMNRNALMQEKLTGYTGEAAEQMRKVESALRVVARGTSAEERGMTAAQKRTRRVQVVLANDDDAGLNSIPDFSGMEDKFIALYAEKRDSFPPNNTEEEREALDEALADELPAFAWYVDNSRPPMP